MFDTHCHLNFKIFAKNLPLVIKEAQKAGVNFILVPGTDIESSKKAVEIAVKYPFVYAAVGIHPHHALGVKFQTRLPNGQGSKIKVQIEELLNNQKAVAVGEVGLDKHIYQKTKYENYHISNNFLEKQKEILILQMKLASKYNKSLILHNRGAVNDLLALLNNNWGKKFSGKTVFHCCEADNRLLNFAKENNIYMGVNGDVTYSKRKQDFARKIPLDLIVLETDAPFLLPEPLKTEKKYPNKPENLIFTVKFIADLKEVSYETLIKKTGANAKKLFSIT